MNYTLYIARQLSLGNDGKRMSPAVTVAIIAIAISVGVMIASVAIVLGFKKEIRDKVVGFNGHISVFKVPTSIDDNNLITLTPFLKSTLDSLSFIKDYTSQTSIPAILKTSNDFKGVYLRGLSGDFTSSYLNKNLEEGEVPDFSSDEAQNKVILSRIAANQLRLNVGDKIETYFISDDVRVRKLEVAGIYNSHFDQYDDVLIFGSMSLVAKLGNLPDNTGTNIIIHTDNFDNIQDYTDILQAKFNDAVAEGEVLEFYKTDNVLNQGRGFFSWLSLLDTNVAVIIILMLVVGCVTLVSGMLIIILERKKFIGLMRALGAPANKIRNVFIFMALRIAVIGLAIGNFIIIAVLYFQDKYHYMQLDADSYYIDFVPVHLPGWTVAIINTGVLCIIYLVLVLPSRFVGRISPAETMLKTE